jgi:hypothetical protein
VNKSTNNQDSNPSERIIERGPPDTRKEYLDLHREVMCDFVVRTYIKGVLCPYNLFSVSLLIMTFNDADSS